MNFLSSVDVLVDDRLLFSFNDRLDCCLPVGFDIRFYAIVWLYKSVVSRTWMAME